MNAAGADYSQDAYQLNVTVYTKSRSEHYAFARVLGLSLGEIKPKSHLAFKTLLNGLCKYLNIFCGY